METTPFGNGDQAQQRNYQGETALDIAQRKRPGPGKMEHMELNAMALEDDFSAGNWPFFGGFQLSRRIGSRHRFQDSSIPVVSPFLINSIKKCIPLLTIESKSLMPPNIFEQSYLRAKAMVS